MLFLPGACSAIWQVRYRGACMGRCDWAWLSQLMQTKTLKLVAAKSCRTDTSLSCLQKRKFWKFLEGEKLPSPQLVKSFSLLLDKKEANAIFINSHTGWFVVRSAGPGEVCMWGNKECLVYCNCEVLDVSPLCTVNSFFLRHLWHPVIDSYFI